MVRGISRLAFRHLLVVILVTVLISAGALLYEVKRQYDRGIGEVDEVLKAIDESYLPSVAMAVFFFDDTQLRLLAEGITLLPYVDSVTIFERRAGEDVPIVSGGLDGLLAESSEIHEYPLRYEYEGENRLIGRLRVTTNLDQLQARIEEQIQVSTVANLVRILAFALVILVVVQRMVFRHLRTITRFFDNLDPQQPGQSELALSRRFASLPKPDELDEITESINAMLTRQERVLQEKSALVQELLHRTGNTVQSVRAILNLQSSRHSDNEPLQSAVRAANNRLLAIALAHQKLHLGGNLSRIGMKGYISELAEEVLQSYQSRGGSPRMKTAIEDVSLLIDTAIPCGMVVCELLSNSLEHAFSHDGTVEISLRRVEDGRYQLTVADDGLGPGADFDVHRDGAVGLQVVVAIVETQLGGEFEIMTRRGMEWRIIFSDSMYSERVAHE